MLKKTLTFITLITLLVVLVGCKGKETTSDQPSTTKTTADTTAPATTTAPKAVIDNYIKATLGSVPEANIDYDLARTLMTTSYAAEFTTPMFIPQAYAMQDGPDSYEITDEEVLTDTATVTVLGHWGTDNQMYWMFELKKEAGDWKLNFINPGQ